MGFIELILINIALSLILYAIRPKVELDDKPGDFRPPAPREGEPIPVVFGTVKVSPSVTWFGDVEAKRVEKTVSSFFGLLKDDVPLGWAYFAGMQLVICHGPIDRLLDVHIGEWNLKRRVAVPRPGSESTAVRRNWRQPPPPNVPFDASVTGDPTQWLINMPDLFGGPEEGGGIVGLVDIHWGSENQGQNDYLALRWGPDILPQYRGLCYAVLRQVYLGKSAQPQPWHFIVQRVPTLLGQPAYASIVDADGNVTANGAECIYEILTNDRWGVGLKAADIDIATFQAVAQTLFTEGLGYCGQITSTQTAWSAIRTILSHMNATLYQDPLTGLLGVKLIREDYVLASLPEFNESNAVLEEFHRGSWAEILNEASVKYTDIARRFSDGAAQAQNLAAIQAMGGEITTQTLDLPGLTTHELAQDAASRSVRTTSVPITRGRIRCTRDGYDLHQGSPFKITFPHFGITNLACRVTRIDYGSLTEGRISIEWVEDPFNHVNPYGSPGDQVEPEYCGPIALQLSGYEPSEDPSADFGNGVVEVIEVPYWHITAAERRWWGFVSKKTNQDIYWTPYVSIHGGEYQRIAFPLEFCALGVLDSDLLKTTIATVASFTVRSLGDMEKLTSTTASGRTAGARLAIIDNGQDQEIVAWETVTANGDGTYTFTNIMRGVLDTVPLQHLQGARVLFYYNSAGAPSAADVTEDAYDDYTRIGLRPARVQFGGEEDDALFSEFDEKVLHQRASAPYPPGNVQLNSNKYDAWPTTTSGDVTLSWTHRSRTLQTTVVAQDDATAYTLEGTVTVEVLINTVVVRTFSGLTGTSQVYTYAQRTADDADLTKKVQFRITPIGTGVSGTPRITPAFTMGA